MNYYHVEVWVVTESDPPTKERVLRAIMALCPDAKVDQPVVAKLDPKMQEFLDSPSPIFRRFFKDKV